MLAGSSVFDISIKRYMCINNNSILCSALEEMEPCETHTGLTIFDFLHYATSHAHKGDFQY